MTQETKIRCQCGHRVTAREVLQAMVHLGGRGATHVYVRFRCARCKRVGRRLVDRRAWARTVLEPIGQHMTTEELERFERLGPVTPEEILDFCEAVEEL